MKKTDQEFGLKRGDLDIIIKILAKYHEIKEALIFGSRSMGNYKPGSDIDIALKGNNIPSILHKVLGELNDETPLPYKFDVVSYDTDNFELKKHVDQFGKKFYP